MWTHLSWCLSLACLLKALNNCVWKYKTIANETRGRFSHSIPFLPDKAICSGCKDSTISLVGRNTCSYRMRNEQSKSEIENTENIIQNIVWTWSKAMVCFGPYVQWNWMNIVITETFRQGNVRKCVERENVSRLSHPPPKHQHQHFKQNSTVTYIYAHPITIKIN